MSLHEQRAAYALSLESNLQSIVARLSTNPAVQRIILFGSYLAGKRDLFTDLDFLVVMESELDYPARCAQVYAQAQPEVDVDLIVYTPKELNENRDTPFIREALKNGKVLYEKTSA